MAAWKEIVDKFRTELPDKFKAFGGTSPFETKTMSARLGEGDYDEQLRKEIYSAMIQEMGAELFIQLVVDARKQAPVVHHFDNMPLDDMIKFCLAVWDVASSLSPRAAIIVSPTHLTMLQAATMKDGGENPFVVDPSATLNRTERQINPINKVGMMGNHVVYCDPYASDNVPTLVAAPGWFSYAAGNTLTASKTVTLPDDESLIHFTSDVKLVVDRSKVKAVSVEAKGLSFR